MTKVLPCECVHEYSDKKYGKGLRVHNSKGRDGKGWRCTVCNKEK